MGGFGGAWSLEEARLVGSDLEFSVCTILLMIEIAQARRGLRQYVTFLTSFLLHRELQILKSSSREDPELLIDVS